MKSQQCKSKDFNFKNHRKSYGLEFIDIKKEIEQELRTLDVRLKNTNVVLPEGNSLSKKKSLNGN